jgi:ribosomal 50S subunit-recycling heat shock protein
VKRIIGAEPPGTQPAVKTVEVGEESAGQRLDNFLLRELKGVPKTHVYRIIRSGEVRVNKGRAAADTRVEVGDVVRLPPVRLPDRVPIPPPSRRPRASSRCCWKTTTCWPSTSRPAWPCTAAAA